MRALAACWSFVAGDSRRAPVAVASAALAAVLLERAHVGGFALAAAFAGTIAAGTIAAAFEPR